MIILDQFSRHEIEITRVEDYNYSTDPKNSVIT